MMLKMVIDNGDGGDKLIQGTGVEMDLILKILWKMVWNRWCVPRGGRKIHGRGGDSENGLSNS
jgi:hypothetical protein